MNNLKNHTPVSEPFLIRLQYLCIFIAGLLEFLAVAAAHHVTFVLLRFGLLCSVCLFCVATFMQMRKGKTMRSLLLPIAMVLWFIIVQHFQQSNPLSAPSYSLFLSVYLLAYPFGLLVRDEDMHIGLKATGLFYIIAALALISYTVLLFMGCVPEFLQNNFFWDGARLNAMVHPNISARLFMIGIAFCLGFWTQFTHKHLKAFTLVVAALLFITLSFTNSRAAMLLTCLLAAGTVFFGIFKGSWKQFILGAAAGLLVAVALFLASQWLFQWNSDRLMNIQSQPPQISEFVDMNAPDATASAESANPQGTLIGDLPTLNNRTGIWKAVFRGIQENPSILLFGTANPAEIAAMGGGIHAHNAWLDVLLKLGLPGLVMSLIFTLQAVWSSLCLLFRQQVSLWKKIIAMLVLCLLVSAMLEPALFITDETWHSSDFMFFLCLGYTTRWKKEIPKVKRT